jgi:hypothetical protein
MWKKMRITLWGVSAAMNLQPSASFRSTDVSFKAI